MKSRGIIGKVVSMNIIWILLCSSFIGLMNLELSQEASGTNIIVDIGGGGDYTTIQDFRSKILQASRSSSLNNLQT